MQGSASDAASEADQRSAPDLAPPRSEAEREDEVTCSAPRIGGLASPSLLSSLSGHQPAGEGIAVLEAATRGDPTRTCSDDPGQPKSLLRQNIQNALSRARITDVNPLLLLSYNKEFGPHLTSKEWQAVLETFATQRRAVVAAGDYDPASVQRFLRWACELLFFREDVDTKTVELLLVVLIMYDQPSRAVYELRAWAQRNPKQRLPLRRIIGAFRGPIKWPALAATTDVAHAIASDWTAGLLTKQMTALAEIGQPARAIQAHKQFKGPGSDRRDTLTLLFRCHLANNDVAAANEVVKQLAARQWDRGPAFTLAMLQGYRSLGYDAKLEQRLLLDLQTGRLHGTTAIFNSMAQLRLDAGNAAGALQLIRLLDFPPTSVVRLWQLKAAEFDETLLNTPCTAKPDLASYTVLLSAFTRLPFLREDSLAALWQEVLAMRGPECDLDNPALSALLRGLVSVGKVDEAVGLLENVVNRRNNKWEIELEQLVAEPFNAVLRPHIRAEGMPGSKRILSLMEQAKVQPDATTIRFLVSAIGALHKAPIDRVATLARQLLDEASLVFPDRALLDLLLMQGVRRKSSADAAEVIARPGAHQLQPEGTRPIDTDGLAGMDMSRQSRQLRGLADDLVETGSRPSASTYTSRMAQDSLRKLPAFPSAKSIYARMVQSGIKPTATHFLQLMQAFARVGRPERAEAIFFMATQELGIVPTVSMWAVLIWAHGQAGNIDACSRAIQRMSSWGLRPTAPVYTTVASALLHARRYTQAVAFLKRHLPDVKDMDAALLHVAFACEVRSTMWDSASRARGFDPALQLLRRYRAIPWDGPLVKLVKDTIRYHKDRRGSGDFAKQLQEVLGHAKRVTTSEMVPFESYAGPVRQSLRDIQRTTLGLGPSEGDEQPEFEEEE